mgnify:CR=1 FL=1
MDIKTKLLMTFKTSDDKKVSITVDNPREDLTETEIKDFWKLTKWKHSISKFVGCRKSCV